MKFRIPNPPTRSVNLIIITLTLRFWFPFLLFFFFDGFGFRLWLFLNYWLLLRLVLFSKRGLFLGCHDGDLIALGASLRKEVDDGADDGEEINHDDGQGWKNSSCGEVRIVANATTQEDEVDERKDDLEDEDGSKCTASSLERPLSFSAWKEHVVHDEVNAHHDSIPEHDEANPICRAIFSFRFSCFPLGQSAR